MKDGLGVVGCGHRFFDWTAVCIALTNSEIDQVFALVDDHTEVEIRPQVRLRSPHVESAAIEIRSCGKLGARAAGVDSEAALPSAASVLGRAPARHPSTPWTARSAGRWRAAAERVDPGASPQKPSAALPKSDQSPTCAILFRQLMLFRDIQAKVRAGQSLDFADGVALFAHPNLLDVGQLANEVRERLHGQRTYFNRNLHINATNVCIASCRFCSFARQQPGDPGAYTMSLDEAWGRLQARVSSGEPVTEVHIVNGLHDGLPFSYYTELLAGLKRIAPAVHLKAFTAVEIHFFHQRYGMPVAEVLARLHAAGLDSLPGGGAEVFAPRVRRKLCPDKCDQAEWLAVHRIAHGMGLRSNCTMLYGHIETVEERVEHLLALRALQAETGGFQSFIPLAFHPDGNAMARLPAPTGIEDLRTVAVARLLLDNIPHLKAYWAMLGLKAAQTAQWFGADDLDGTVQEERIYHMAGASSPERLSTADLVHLITRAGRVPVERDTLYNVLAEGQALLSAGPYRRHLPVAAVQA